MTFAVTANQLLLVTYWLFHLDLIFAAGWVLTIKSLIITSVYRSISSVQLVNDGIYMLGRAYIMRSTLSLRRFPELSLSEVSPMLRSVSGRQRQQVPATYRNNSLHHLSPSQLLWALSQLWLWAARSAVL